MIGKIIQIHGQRYKRWLGRALRSAAKQGMRRIWAQVVQTSGARIYGLLISMIALSITARYLGPEGRGIVAAADSWVRMFATFGSLSLGQVLIHLVAGKKQEEWLPAILGTLLVIVTLTTLLGWGIVATGYLVTDGEMFNNLTPVVLILAFAALPLLLMVENGRYLLMALDSLTVLNVAQMIGPSLSIATIVGLIVFLGWGVQGALVAILIAQLVTAGISFGFAFRQGGHIYFDRQMAKRLLIGSVKLHLNAIGAFLFTQANVVIMNHFRPPAETGYYQLAVRLISILQIIPISINTVVYTVVTREGPDRAWTEHRRLLGQSLVLISVIMVIAYLLAPFAIVSLAGSDFMPSVALFRMLLLALPGMTFSIVMSSQWIGRGLFLQAALITLFVGILNAIGNYVFIPGYGMVGAVWVTILTYVISVIGNGLMALWVENRWRKMQMNHD